MVDNIDVSVMILLCRRFLLFYFSTFFKIGVLIYVVTVKYIAIFVIAIVSNTAVSCIDGTVGVKISSFRKRIIRIDTSGGESTSSSHSTVGTHSSIVATTPSSSSDGRCS